MSFTALDTFNISRSNQFTTICHTGRTRETLAVHRKSGKPSSSPVRLSSHATDVSISQIAREPSGGVVSNRSKRDENVELASTRDFRSSAGRGVEMEATRLALRLRWEVESKEGGNIGGTTVLEDFAVALVMVHGTSSDVI